MNRDEIQAGLEIRVLGPFSIVLDGEVQPAPSKKALALLAYLARRPNVQVPRETIAGLLWSDVPDNQARASLRQSLTLLRRCLGAYAEALRTDTQSVRLVTEKCNLDVSAFETAAEKDPAAATKCYRGMFLEGCGPVSPEFDRWVEAERRHLQALQADCLLKAADEAEANGQFDAMVAFSARLLEFDPLQEHVHRRLMRAQYRQSHHDAALKQFSDLSKILADELGVRPEKATIDLVAEIRAARAGSGQVKAKAAVDEANVRPLVPSRPSIAILPFRALGSGQDAVFLGEGVAEDVITELARNKSIMTVARHSSFRFSEEATDAKEIGQQLGVRFLLGGSVRVVGNRARVTAHLVRCEDGQQLWAERFDRELADIFEIQIEIARTVTATVVGQIEADIISQNRDRPADALESHVLVLRAMRDIDRTSKLGFESGIAQIERALKIDPGNARARGLLALTRVYLEWHYNIGNRMEQAIAEAQAALRLDQREPKAHCALGVALTIERRFDEASHHFQAGMNTNPNDEQLLVEYGRHLMYVDRPEDGIRSIREAMRLNPFHPSWYWSMVGRCLHTLGRYEEAIECFRRMEDPPFYIYGYLASCLAMLGDIEGARMERERLYALRPDFNLQQFRSIFPYKNEQTAERFFLTFEKAGIR